MTGPRRGWWLGAASGRGAALTIALVLLSARVVWLTLFSRLTLTEDEAHYWVWAQHPAWSYYSKGPGVAWVIWLGTRLFGDVEWAVRLPAAVAGFLGMLGAAAGARWALPEERAAPAIAALLYALVPGFAVAGVLMTIDGPYLACWAWAGAFAALALLRGSGRAWLGFGAMVGLGFLFKYTVLLIVPGVVLAAWVTRGSRPAVRRGALVAGAAVACLGLLPVLVWNAGHGWVTVRHLLGHLGAPGGDTRVMAGHGRSSWTPAWMGEYLALQAGVCGAVLALGAFAWINAGKHADAPTRAGVRAMAAMGAGVFGFYFLVSLVARTEGNWAMSGACTLCVAGAWAVIDAMRRNDRPVRFAWGVACVMGIAAILALPTAPFLSTRAVIGRYIPAHRLTGMRVHAAAVARAFDDLERATGQTPVVMAEHYGRASQLEFYLGAQYPVFCAQSLLGGRRTQYDLWTSTDMRNPTLDAELRGRPALLLGGRRDQWEPGFDELTDIGALEGEPKPKTRTAWIGLGYKGAAALAEGGQR